MESRNYFHDNDRASDFIWHQKQLAEMRFKAGAENHTYIIRNYDIW